MGKWAALLEAIDEKPGRATDETRITQVPRVMSVPVGGAAQSARDELDLAAVAWTDADIERYLLRLDRLLRWGWLELEAEKLAERLVRRDREGDDRVSCAGECTHYRSGRCGNHRSAGLQSADVGRDLASMLQRCSGASMCP